MSSAAKPLELVCAVYGEQNAFHVKIAPDAEVSALQEVLAARLSTEAHKIDSRLVTLYLAKKENVWLKDDEEETEFLHGNVVDKQYKKMRSTWMLSDPKYFGVDFEPQPKDIHVLVKEESEVFFCQDRKAVVVDGVGIPITEGMKINPPELVAFWNALATCTTAIEVDALIKLAEGAYLLGDSSLGSSIYVRHCYPQLLDHCWKVIHDESTGIPHIVVLGNPGIGKTFFGYLILLHLARRGSTVVYETRARKRCYLFTSGKAFIGSQSDFEDILRKPTTYYIVDAVEPTYYPAKTILLTSPRRSVWYEFSKTKCRTCFMPVWSSAELMKCRDLVYRDVSDVTVADCFRRWGGIARYVLAYANFRDQQDMLEKAIAAVDLDVLVQACGEFEANDAQISHRLLH
ncbi:hypothetical protein Poli38472_013455 [Pythium oligandrum]|uniref:Crinkler effector protein N-terminal domain-containing protein n=1 Tax=Pythium oligandrum TaxID=41045 RepID=A0A8K1C7D1_PYTOL|nr:hypothetical protein Poli38472_013455 [Pythium oligandrum]|eukprot:TMW57981.1 hypothetical protein Poli38472_013455 [Pythium oligandrum]